VVDHSRTSLRKRWLDMVVILPLMAGDRGLG
jgi:hypothetical protein